MENTETKVVETASTVQTPEVDVHALQEQLEAIKKSQSGSDKAYQEQVKAKLALEIELDKLKKEKMSEKERAEFEFAKKKAELEAKSREVAEATLRLSKVKLMGEKGIALEYADYINGSNDAEIIESIDTFNKLIDKLVSERVNKTLLGNQKPQAGAETANKTKLLDSLSLHEINKLAVSGKLQL